MKCLYPMEKVKFYRGTRFLYSHRCGQCTPCRITRRQEWTARILLETKSYDNNTFLTLTIADDDSKDYPPNMRTQHDEGYQLNKSQLQKFIKRLRKQSGRFFRYFAVGEYGEHTNREHYHLALFNYPFWDTEPIISAWQFGNIQSDELTKARAYYIAGYVTKKLTTPESMSCGRNPEFALMSRGHKKRKTGGLGLSYIKKVGENLRKANKDITDTNGCIRVNGTLLPLDAYAKEKLNFYSTRYTDFPHFDLVRNKGKTDFQKWLQQDVNEGLKMANPVLEIEEKKLSARKAKRRMRQKKGVL